MTVAIAKYLQAGLRAVFPPVTEPLVTFPGDTEAMTEAARRAIADPVQGYEHQRLRGTGRTRDLVMSLPNDGRMVHVVVHTEAFKANFKNTVANARGSWFRQRIQLHSLVEVARGSLRGIDRSRIYWDHEAERMARLQSSKESA